MFIYLFIYSFEDVVIDEYEDYDEEYNEELNLEELAGVFRIQNGHLDEDDTQDLSCSLNPISASINPISASMNPIPTSMNPISISMNPISTSMNPISIPNPTPVTPRTSTRKKQTEQKNNQGTELTGDIDVWWLYDDGGNAFISLIVSLHKMVNNEGDNCY